MHFTKEQFSNCSDVCSQESNWQENSIGSDNGLVPHLWQAIAFTNTEPVHRRMYAALTEQSSVV